MIRGGASMRRSLIALTVFAFIASLGCAKKKIVTEVVPEPVKPAIEETTQEAQKAKPDDKAAAVAAEQEKITEKEVAAEAGKSGAGEAQTADAEAGASKSDSAKKMFVAEVKGVCAPDAGQSAVFESVFFDFDSYAINDGARPTLNQLSAWLSGGGAAISIEGHCDERGTDEYNLALGDRRASSVRDFLVHSGVSAGRLQTVSCGEERPVCAEQTEECWAKNRRARFVLIKKSPENNGG